MGILDIIALLALCATLLSLLVALFLSKEQQSTQAFISYTEKYDRVVKELAQLWEKRDSHYVKDYSEDENIVERLLPYFHLCSQQFHLYTHGLIKTSVWEIWEPAIEENLYFPLFSSAWGEKTITKEFNAYPDFKSFVGDLLRKGPGHKVADSYMRIRRPFSGRSR